MRRLSLPVLFAAALPAVVTAQVDANATAQALFNQATASMARAAAVLSDDLATQFYHEGISSLTTIGARYPNSDIAVQIASGPSANGFSLSQSTDPIDVSNSAMAPRLGVGDSQVALRYPAGSGPVPGQVVFFRLTGEDPTLYARRLIGLPGDHVEIGSGGGLTINGKAVPRQRLAATADPTTHSPVNQYRETLFDGYGYTVLDRDPTGVPAQPPQVYDVPAGSYFFLGDNRPSAADSRLPQGAGGLGFVPIANVIARAVKM